MFERALEEMEETGSRTFGPVSFVSYAAEVGRRARTAESISRDSLAGLPACLRARSTMVFRLGCPPGERNTRFALAQCVEGWSDYFLLDDIAFGEASPEPFSPSVPMTRLAAFALLPAVTETSLVNLAIASGLLSRALELDGSDFPSAPATGQSTFSFPVTPHPQLGVTWQHVNGQVEFDALLVTRRTGQEVVLLVEAKRSNRFDSLAKHKLVYPALALRQVLPAEIPVVPVYLRIIPRTMGYEFYVAECAEATLEMAVSSLEIVRASAWRLTDLGRQTTWIR